MQHGRAVPPVLILAESDLRQCVTLDLAAIDCVEGAFAALAGGEVVMPPVLSMAIEEHRGEVDVKTAYVSGIDSFAIKMSPGFFDNPRAGLPSTSGLMVLFSARTGMLEALLLDNGYLTDVRTAAAGAVAARHLAREGASTACVIGAGTQAALQLKALCLVRPITRAHLWARDKRRAESAACRLRDELSIDVVAADDRETAVRAADIVITTTPSTEPLVNADWLQPGQHITAMGSDQSHKNELQPGCLTRADRYVPDRQTQTALLGELHHALDAGLIEPTAVFPELGQVIAGHVPGRTTAEEITVSDLTGTGVQDTAIATFARQCAMDQGCGIDFDIGTRHA